MAGSKGSREAPSAHETKMQQQNLAKVVKLVQSVDGTKIYADAVGDAANPALIFAHGFSGSGAAFDPIFLNPKNSKEFFLVRYDVRGHGRSGKPSVPEGYSSEKFAEDFDAVSKAFEVREPIFIGWSMGGRIIADIATYLPTGTLRGAVCLAGAPYSDSKMRDSFSTAINTVLSGIMSTDNVTLQQQATLAAYRLLFLRDPNPSADFLSETDKGFAEGAYFLEDNPEISWETRCTFIGVAMHMSPTERMLVVSRQQDNTKVLELAKSGFPILVVFGTHDAYVSGEKMVETLRPVFSNLKVKMIEEGSHAPFVDKPDDVMDAIVDFAKGLN